jgi:ubiquinone/menaquinone biosynthesis C-methylase UbiE
MTRRTDIRFRGLLLIALLPIACQQVIYRHMNDPERDVWQRPAAVIQALQIPAGAHVADLGAGRGYFTFRLAEAVGLNGQVYAVDTEEASLPFIEQEAIQRGGMSHQVQLILAAPNDRRLPLHGMDLIFTCDTYHHLPDRQAYMASLAQYLRQDGRIAIIDFEKGSWLGSLFGHATSQTAIQKEMEAAGYRLLNNFDFLPKQHFQVFALNTHG